MPHHLILSAGGPRPILAQGYRHTVGMISSVVLKSVVVDSRCKGQATVQGSEMACLQGRVVRPYDDSPKSESESASPSSS